MTVVVMPMKPTANALHKMVNVELLALVLDNDPTSTSSNTQASSHASDRDITLPVSMLGSSYPAGNILLRLLFLPAICSKPASKSMELNGRR